jgi:hypothetical protein
MFLKPYINHDGYAVLRMSNDNIKYTFKVHKIVADHYLIKPKTTEKLQVNHKNKIRSDNTLDNLEWVTASENIFHSYENKPRVQQPPCKFIKTSNTIYCIDVNGNTVGTFGSFSEAALSINVHRTTIAHACLKNQKCKNFFWKVINTKASNTKLVEKSSNGSS